MAQVGAVPPTIPDPGAAGLALVKSSTSTPAWGALASSTGCAPVRMSGRWYSNMPGPGITGNGAGSSLGFTKAVIYVPIYSASSFAVTALGGIFSGGVNPASVRMAVYSSDTSGYPATVLFQAASFSVGASAAAAAYSGAATGTIPAGVSYIALGSSTGTNGANFCLQLLGNPRSVPLRGGSPSATAPKTAQITGYVDNTAAFNGAFVNVVAVSATPSAPTVYYKVA